MDLRTKEDLELIYIPLWLNIKLGGCALFELAGIKFTFHSD